MRFQTTMSKEASPVGGRRRPWIQSRRAILLGLIPAAAIAAACGSSSTSSTSSTTKATTSTSSSGPPAVQTANNSKFGTILVDSQGRTLYTLTNNGANVPCTGACLAVWPPSLLPSGQTTVSTGPGVSNVTAVGATGGMQVAYKGMPLYRFSGDVNAGAANGDGINSFGGIWHVVKTSGGSTSSGGTTGAGSSTTAGGGSSSTTSGGGYGGGY
jgi:predicted lipoprotein with Yx(FWY)xxD motif